MRRAIKIVLGILGGLVLLALVAFALLQTEFGRRQVLALIEDQLSDPPARLRAQRLEGTLPFDMTLVGATLADRDGVWLEADRLALDWSPLALLARKLSIQSLAADRIAVLRAPVSPPTPESAPASFELPRLPVDIDLQHLAVARLELAADFLGEPAVFSIDAAARLGDPSRGLQAKLALTRIDRDVDRAELTLDYRPAADTLAIDLRADEPEGGLIARLIGLPGKPAFSLTLSGSGPLTDWQAKGQAVSDGRPLLDLAATSRGSSQDRNVTFTAEAHALPMLSADLAPLVAGGVAAEGHLHLTGLDQPIRIEALNVKTAASALTAQGSIDPGASMDLALKLDLGGSAPFAALIPPELSWGSATAEVRLAGPFARPKVTIDGRVSDLAYAGNRAGDSAVSLEGMLDPQAMRIEAMTAAVQAQAIAVDEPKLQPLLADGVALDFAGALDLGGAITADHLHLGAGSIALDAQGAATGWGDTADFKGRLEVGALAPLLDSAGLHGRGTLAADLTLGRAAGTLSATLDAAASEMALGIPEVDGLLGPAPKLALALRQDADGLVTLDRAQLNGAAVTLTAGGTMDADRKLDLNADATLGELKRVLPQATGALSVVAAVGGSADDPAAKLKLASERITLDRITLARLQASVDAKALVTAPQAILDAKAEIGALPATLRADAAFNPETGRVSAESLAARLGATQVDGKLDLADGLIDGDLSFASTALRELGALVDVALDGTAKGKVRLHRAGGRQGVALDAGLEALEVAGTRVAHADLSASAEDAFGKDPVLDATLAAAGIDAAGQSIDRLDAKATGRTSDLAVSAEATGRDLAMTTAGTIRSAPEETGLTLTKLDLTLRQTKASLQHPAEIAFAGSSTRISNLAIASGGGMAALDAELGAEGNRLTVTLKQLPLSLAEPMAPDLHLLGTVDGSLRLDGPKTAPQATVALQGRGLGVAGASAQLLDLTLNGDWTAGRLKANGKAVLDQSAGLDFTASLPLPADPASGFPVFDPAAPLAASAKGTIDLGIANAFIPGGADHVAGQAVVDLSAGGAVGRPILAGQVAITDGRYENQRYGTRLQQLTASLEGSGSKLRLVSLSARTPGGGTLSGEGDLDFAGSMPVAIAIHMAKARMINAPIGTAVVDGDLAMQGAMTGDLALSGKVKIVKAEIRIPDRLPADVEEIPVKEINLPPARQAEVDAAAEAPPPKSIRIGLDLAVDAPEQVFVRGRGLDAEMGGSLKITGTADRPEIAGALKLRRGDFNLLSRRLAFDRGTVTFSGGERINPELDFAASTKLPDADVTATVTGTALKPAIALASAPPLPQDEILARLLFGKASGALSPFEAVQLAQAAAELAGVEAGPNVLDKIRKTFGLDRLDVQAGEGTSTAPSLSAGRYVTRGVFVGAKQGAAPNSSAATVEIEVTPNVKIETDVGADSSGKAGINLEWNY